MSSTLAAERRLQHAHRLEGGEGDREKEQRRVDDTEGEGYTRRARCREEEEDTLAEREAVTAHLPCHELDGGLVRGLQAALVGARGRLSGRSFGARGRLSGRSFAERHVEFERADPGQRVALDGANL